MQTGFGVIDAMILVAGVWSAGHAAAQVPVQSAERTLHRRAVKAVIWGMLAVNLERMLQAAIANVRWFLGCTKPTEAEHAAAPLRCGRKQGW